MTKMQIQDFFFNVPFSKMKIIKKGTIMSLVPNIVFQTWKSRDIPPKWQKLYKGWQKFCAQYGYTHVLFSDKDNRNLIKQEYSWFLPTYDAYKYNIQRADAVRYFYAHKYGCIYSDLDMCPKPEKFDELHAFIQDCKASATIPITKNKVWKDTLTNSFMIVRKGSVFMEQLWQSLLHPELYHWSMIKSLLRQTHKFEILFTTGPGIVSDQALRSPHGLVSFIPECLISDPNSVSCLMLHEIGGSWHNHVQMTRDVLRLVIIALALVLLFLFAILGFISWVRKSQRHTKHIILPTQSKKPTT